MEEVVEYSEGINQFIWEDNITAAGDTVEGKLQYCG